MKTFSIVLSLLLPLVFFGQTQIVSFLPEESDLAIDGKYSKLVLTFEIENPYYIQMDEAQIPNEDLIPTRISIEPSKGLSVCRIGFSKSQTTKLFDAYENIPVLEGRFSVQIEVETPNDILSGVYPIKGQLYYQASDIRQCFPPKVLNFETRLEVIMP